MTFRRTDAERKGKDVMDLLQRISEELQKGNHQQLPGLVQEALNSKISAAKILSDEDLSFTPVLSD